MRRDDASKVDYVAWTRSENQPDRANGRQEMSGLEMLVEPLPSEMMEMNGDDTLSLVHSR